MNQRDATETQSAGDKMSPPPQEIFKEWVERNIRAPMRILKQRREKKDESTEAYLKNAFCFNPFWSLETTPSGLAHVCCPSWLPTPVGALNGEVKDFWYGRKATAIRQSIIDGSFDYCSRRNCPRIADRTLPTRDNPIAQEVIEQFHKQTLPLPQEVVLSHDRSCNLSCPSCRTKTIIADKVKQRRLDDTIERLLVPLLGQADKLYITGSGDPFGSNHFRRLIQRLNAQEFPKLRLHLHTNGQLWNARAWQDLNLSGRVDTALISIDAASKETYEVLRRGGSYERLLENLAFISELRQAGEIKKLTFGMVIQQQNFREMPAFVHLGKQYLADHVTFQMIRNWGTLTKKEFDREFIGSPSHPEHKDFVDMLAHPDLNDPRNVEANEPYAAIGNLRQYAV